MSLSAHSTARAYAIALAIAVLGVFAGACGQSRDSADTVVLWHAYQGTERTALETIADEFNAQSGDTKIKLVSVPYDAFADKITNAIPNGNGPDLFIFAHDRIGDWVAAELIEPIEYFVDEDLAKRFAFDALAAMAYRGSLYGLPLAVKSVVMFYRTDLVAEPPTTTDEMIAWGQEFMKGGDRFGLVYQNTDLYGHAPWLHGFGARLFDDDGNLTLVTPQATAALNFARELTGKNGIVPPEVTGTMAATLFNEGKAGLAISGPWFVADIGKDVPWGVTTLPRVSATDLPAAPFLGAEGLLMSARARDKHAAFTVMNYLASDRAAALRARTARQVVANLAAYDESDIGADKVLVAFRNQLEHTVPMPATPSMRMVWTPYKSALQNVISQGTDAADALRAAEREVLSYIDGARAR